MSETDTISFASDPQEAAPGKLSWIVGGLCTTIVLFAIFSLDAILTGFYHSRVHGHIDVAINNTPSMRMLLEDEYVKRLPIERLKKVEIALELHQLVIHKEYLRALKVVEAGKIPETPLVLQLKGSLSDIKLLFGSSSNRSSKELDPSKLEEVEALRVNALEQSKSVIKEITLPEIDPLSARYYEKFGKKLITML
jgi:hypothetical protein